MKPLSLTSVLITMLALFTHTKCNAGNGFSDVTLLSSWKQVDSLVNAGLPKSALLLVDKIYDKAVREKNDPQYLKAVIYRLKLKGEYRQDMIMASIRDLKAEIARSQEPARQVLYSILGEICENYYQTKRYRFADRTQAFGNTSDSIQTWDLNTLTRYTASVWLHSLNNPSLLKSIPIGNFEDILEKGNPILYKKSTKSGETNNDSGYRPTLFDFLAWRALDYFSASAGPDRSFAGGFYPDKPEYFMQAGEFSRLKLDLPSDSSSFTAFALHIYQDLTGFHIKDKDPPAIIDEEIKRFGYLRETCIIPGKDSLYQSAMKKLQKEFSSSPYSSDVAFAIASFLREKGMQSIPSDSEKNKWNLKEAVQICSDAIKEYPESVGAGNCRILKAEIEMPSLQVTAESGVTPDKPSPGILNIRNIKKIYFRIAKNDPDENRNATQYRSRDDLIRYYAGLPSAKNWSIDIPNDGDYRSHSIEFTIPALSAGFYALVASSDQDFKDTAQEIVWTTFFSTQISYINKQNEKGAEEFYILNRETGQPLKNVKAQVFVKNFNYNTHKYEDRQTGEFLTDENGYFSIPPVQPNSMYNNEFLRLTTQGDSFVSANFFRYPLNPGNMKAEPVTFFFTDRSVYRPGQLVYFKGILLEKSGDNYSIKPGIKVSTEFRDVNNQKIATAEFTTNGFGSFNGTFVIPAGLLNGTMSISDGSGSVSFSVEDYKRPTFEVKFDTIVGNYRLNDTVKVTGRASGYAGNSIDGAEVEFRVVREVRFPYWFGDNQPIPGNQEIEIARGNLKSLTDGSFTVKFRAFPDPYADALAKPVYDYVIYADVTDVNGETQTGNQIVSCGYNSLLIGLNLPSLMDPEKDTVFRLTSTNLSGRSTPATVKVVIQRLRQPGRFFADRSWHRPDLMGMTEKEFHDSFPHLAFKDEDLAEKWPVEAEIMNRDFRTGADTGLRFTIYDLRTDKKGDNGLIPGIYRLILSATDPYGQNVEQKSVFVVYDPSSEKVPVPQADWFVAVKTSGVPGEKAAFLIGSKAENVSVIYEVRVHDTLYSRQWIRLSNNQKLIGIPIREGFRGNFAVNFNFIRFNRSFQHSQIVTVPYTNKKLEIKYSTFRDKLNPEKDEQWRIRITDGSGKGVKAEYLTSMYDASLDAFKPHDWSFSIFKNYFTELPWDNTGSFHSAQGTYYPRNQITGVYQLPSYEELNWFGFSISGGGRFMLKNSMSMDEMPPSMQTEEAVASDLTTSTGKNQTSPAKFIQQTHRQEAMAEIRRDFRESAFFYPSLVTDSAGNLDVRFTVPGSLTRWKIMGFAYTKDLYFGFSEKELLTQKDLMVFPNAPRFVRKGDTLMFSARVVNLSGNILDGYVKLDISDALKQTAVNGMLTEKNQHFNIQARQSVAVTWKLAIPDDATLSVLQYHIEAQSGNFSDGEERAFPVLPNRILVTESLPMPVYGKGTFGFRFDKLLKSSSDKTLKNYRLTLEFTSNPAWYAVQALPTMDDPRFPNADNIFRSWYTNSIGFYLANSNPKIKKVFGTWRELPNDALLSSLMKNEDLKSALLKEMPWVLQSQEETERKHRLALFFDMNTMKNRLDGGFADLKKLQSSSGGWPWFAGMPENRFITQDIVTGLGHLDNLGIRNFKENPETRDILMKAVNYLDQEMLKEYQEIKRNNPSKMDDNHLRTIDIQYLYARTYFLNEVPLKSAGDLKTGFEYFKSQAEKHWLKQGLQGQAMIALAMNRLGNKDVALGILRSLTERALHSSEMGMYWASEIGYSWYQAPIETQALLIEAFDEIGGDTKSVNDMKVWLLKQKQTQDWETGRATAEACYALLLRGNDLLSENPDVQIGLGQEIIDAGKMPDIQIEAGTGYFQVYRSGNEIKPEMGNVKVTKSNDGAAWGAMYWEYFQDMDKVSKHESPVKVEKDILIPNKKSSNDIRHPSSGIRHLKVGDKVIVRIILTVDRNLEYVHLKDLRASAFEPPVSEQISGYRFKGGLGYYQTTTDESTNFFFDYLPAGTWVFEYPLVVNAAGNYSAGMAAVQCMYAPEFGAHTQGTRIVVNNE